ncbi:Flp pilus assembly protein TadG [Sphingomonas sp. SORGH_AS 950]|uniref:TadE/TadG family type IV pilus assembly protein n=1 Tax=Sphingomonas sp. SORGH_AS_0950 TaxID=3041792 RepID=UPI00278391D1|nr:TadE/TadG family type IV pilus assembly protein [Sphingomonas sp. SORGH_AS_0950]MDQ1158271.1 Flp pilus assembly protein TadG [Sphingomonas sp. SORGH_AS_0950]
MRRRVLATMRGDTRGVALVEFALILPVMLLLYLGGVQLQDGIACNRKVTIATRAAADLIAQNTTGIMSAAEVQDNLVAAAQVLQPYAADKARFRITEIATDARGNTTVQWSRGLNTAGYAVGTTLAVPAAMRGAGTYFLLAEVSYAYSPPVSFGTIGPMTFQDRLFMVPRNTDKIDCSNCQ